MATRIASKSPLTLKVTKQVIRAGAEMSLSAGINYERDLFCLCFSTEDQEEGVDAFLNKRQPEWKGR